MPISFQCACGKPLTAKEEMAGRKTKCPVCGSALTIPGTPPKPAIKPKNPPLAASGVPVNPDALEVEGLVWTGAEIATAETATEGAAASSAPAEIRASDQPRPTDGSVQYKVLGQKDHSATGKVNLASLETCLNDQARIGWVVKSAFVINVQSHSGHHDELVVILER